MIKAAAAMVKCLESEGVKVVFGYPGAAICPFYDELSKSSIRHILVRQESNAGHAASGYARMTNSPAVCIATSGPGAVNLLTSIATAYADGVPLIAITGQVPTDQIGGDVFQEADIIGASEPFVKYSYLVKKAADIPRIFKEAFYLAGAGRKGPVLIDVPVDMQMAEIEFDYPEKVDIRSYKPTVKGNALQIKRIGEALSVSERPVICAGGGVFWSDAQGELVRLVKETGIPVVSTMMGISLLTSDDPLYLGMLGMHGVNAANEAVARCDTMLLVGARVGDRAVRSPGFLAENKKIIHIDIDPAEIGKNIRTDIPIVGDCKDILSRLAESVTPGKGWGEWAGGLSDMKSVRAKFSGGAGPINPKGFIRALSDKLPPDAVCAADVGQNQIWTCNGFNFKEGGRLLTSGGMGTMGYSIPCAIGAKLSAPDREAVAICGDGAFQMQMMELATIIQENLNIKIIIMRNNRLGMVRELQTNYYGDNQTAVNLINPDFVALTESYGITAERISSWDEVDDALNRLVESKTARLLECNVSEDEASL